MQLVILAAGMGSRFGGLKQMEPMDEYGNFIIDYSIYDAVEAGFDSIVLIIKKEHHQAFEDTIGKRLKKIVKVEYAFQDMNDLPEGFKVPEGREKPWGTSHAIYAARNVIRESFAMINGDDYYGKESFKIAYDFLSKLPKDSKGVYANVAYKIANTMTENGSVKRGVCAGENDMMTKLIESSISKEDGKYTVSPLDGSEGFEINADQVVSMNFFCFTKDYVDLCVRDIVPFLTAKGTEMKSEFLVPIHVNELIAKKEIGVKILPSPCVWYGVTYKEDKELVVKAFKELVDKGLYKKGLY
ncbi:MAG: nucleotidyltransferase [Bacilli bacterium]|nr:nucleotidyltransferase [Bacilli bacterium]